MFGHAASCKRDRDASTYTFAPARDAAWLPRGEGHQHKISCISLVSDSRVIRDPSGQITTWGQTQVLMVSTHQFDPGKRPLPEANNASSQGVTDVVFQHTVARRSRPPGVARCTPLRLGHARHFIPKDRAPRSSTTGPHYARRAMMDGTQIETSRVAGRVRWSCHEPECCRR